MRVFVIAAIFWFFARPGLNYYFTDDDIMNLRQSWPAPVTKHLYQIATLAPQGYRPAGLLFYRGMYALAGLHPRPFHWVRLGLLGLNIYLLFLFTREITGSKEIAALAALIGSFHSRMDALYADTATIYDILCYTFYFAFLLLYVRWRKADSSHWVVVAITLIALDLLALNSKEMAITLPIIVLAYEVLYRRSDRLTSLKRYVVPAITILITALFCLRKATGETPLTISYRPQYTLSRVLENWQAYIPALFYQDGTLPVLAIIAIWLALLTSAVLLRSKAFALGCVLILLGPIPVCFVEPRGIAVLYVPFLSGWPICLAVLILAALRRVNGTVVFAAVALCLVAAHWHDRPNRLHTVIGKDDLVRALKTEFLKLHPTVPRPGYILFLDDPFAIDEWTPNSLLQLCYNDPELDIMRMKLPDQRSTIAGTKFDIIVTYRNGHYLDAPAPGSQ